MPDSDNIQDIIAHRKNGKNRTEYCLKLKGKSYSNSIWVSEDYIKSNKLQNKLAKYNKSKNMKNTPPYYNPKFDEIDKIIGMQNGLYIVKWCELDYTELTYEENIPDDMKELYLKRKSIRMPKWKSTTKKIPMDLDDIEINGFSDFQKTILNCLLNTYESYDEIVLANDYSFDLRNVLLEFFKLLYDKVNNCGPFLIITNPSHIPIWNELLCKDPDLVSLVYDGTIENRKIIDEIDFTDGNFLKFNVIITSTDILQNVLTTLNKINFYISVNDHQAYLKNQPNAVFKINLQNDKKSVTKNILDLTDICLSSSEKELISSEDLMSILQQKQFLQSYTNKESSLPKIQYYYINCPNSNIQKEIIKSLLMKYNGLTLLNYVYNVSVHPYLLYGMEAKLYDFNCIEISTRLNVFYTLFKEKMKNNLKILVISEFTLILDLIEDLILEEGYFSVRIDKPDGDYVNDPSSIFLYNPTYCPLYISTIDHINCAIVIDGDIPKIETQLNERRSINSNFKSIYWMKCNEIAEKELQSIYRGIITDEETILSVCKTIAFHSFYKFNEIIPENLIQEASKEPLDNYLYEDNQIFLDNDSFWKLIRENIETIEYQSNKTYINREWSLRERNQLYRYLFRFGWGRWDEIINAGALLHEKHEVINASRSLIKEMLQGFTSTQESFPLIRDFIRQSNNEESSKDIDFINKGVFGKSSFHDLIHDNSVSMLKRLEFLYYLDLAVMQSNNNIDKLLINRTVGENPYENWSDEHDKMLVYGAHKYGFGLYDSYLIDSDHRFQEIINFGNVNLILLDERLLKICESLKRTMNTNIKKEVINHENKAESFTQKELTKAEKTRLLQYLMKFGIDDYNKMKKNTKIKRLTIKELQDYIDAHIIKSINSPNSVSTPMYIEIVQRINAMKNLRELIKLGIEVFQKAPEWNQMPESWTPELEYKFFSELSTKGFGSETKIIGSDEFKLIDFPTSVLNDDSIINRIITLYEASQKMTDSTSDQISSSLNSNTEKTSSNPSNLTVETSSSTTENTNTASNLTSSEYEAKDSNSNEISSPKSVTTSQFYAPKIKEIISHDINKIAFPYKINGTSFILNIGHIITDRPLFHTENYIYPAGYKSSRLFTSLDDPKEKVTWISEIIDNGGDAPIFKVTMEGSNHVFSGGTPTAPWSKVLKALSKIVTGKGKSISGPDAFLLKSPITMSLIQKLPGTDHLKNYHMKTFNYGQSLKKLSKTTKKRQKNNSDSNDYNSEEEYDDY